MADGAGKHTQGHVLALPLPFQGHINPLLQLSRRISAEGVTVSFILTPHFHARIAPSLQEDKLPIRLISLTDACSPPPDLRVHGSMALYFQFIIEVMSKEVEDVMRAEEKQYPSLPFTCLLSDILIPFAQHLADKFSIARMAFWTQSAASYCYHAAIAQGFQIPTDELAMVDCIPGVPSHTLSDVPIIFRPDVVGSKIVDFITKPFKQVNEALLVVLNTLETLEPEGMEALRVQGWNIICIGPLLPLAYLDTYSSAPQPPKGTLDKFRVEEKHICLKWLDACKPSSVLYISFGTLVTLEEAEFKELALGIEASQQSFLWSLRPNMVSGNPISFIEAFQERTKHMGLVLPWVPQLEVLSHASIGGFLTHCGWNSSLESMCRGVPMIGMPISGEQQLNMVCLADSWKVCLAMERDVRRDQVEKVVHDLFAGPQAEELRCAALKVQDLVACREMGSLLSNFKPALKLIVAGKGLAD